MQLEISNLENGVKQANLIGRLDMQGTNEISDRFTFATTAEKTFVLVDMAEVDFLASIGMRMLLSSAKAQAKRGGKVILFQPTSLVKEALQMAGLFELIPVYDDLDEVCAALTSTVSS